MTHFIHQMAAFPLYSVVLSMIARVFLLSVLHKLMKLGMWVCLLV